MTFSLNFGLSCSMSGTIRLRMKFRSYLSDRFDESSR